MLYALQLDDDILLLAKEDVMGKALQDLSLKKRELSLIHIYVGTVFGQGEEAEKDQADFRIEIPCDPPAGSGSGKDCSRQMCIRDS